MSWLAGRAGTAPSTHPRRDQVGAALAAAAAAAGGADDPFGPEREAYFALQARWKERPRGRGAEPGDLMGWWLPGEYPHGGDIRCRRCGAVSSMEGHPYGCPRTPSELGFPTLDALRRCYCGQVLIVTPETAGPCCEGTLPVRVPGGCRWCGSDLRRVNDPDELPEKDWYVATRIPGMGDAWVHPCCVDESMLARAADVSHVDLAADVAERRRKRHLPVGVLNP